MFVLSETGISGQSFAPLHYGRGVVCPRSDHMVDWYGQITWWTGYRQPVFSRKELTFGVGGPINGYSWEATFIPLAQWGTVTFSVYSMLTANVYSLCMARAWLVFEGDQTAMWRGGLASGHYFGRGGSVWSGVLSGGAAPRRLACLAAQGRQSLH